MTLDPTALSVAVGETSAISADVTPANATNKALTWESADESVVTVDNGTVKGETAGGPIEVTATAADGSGVSASVAVTVTEAASKKKTK